MDKNFEDYLETLTRNVQNAIDKIINRKNINEIILDIKWHSEKKQISFHKYYLEITSSKADLDSNNFFRLFRRQYALQGISNKYLDDLESQKPHLLTLIKEEKLSDLYFRYFYKVAAQSDDKTRTLGSFFSKLVHTFKPNAYCPLDNLVKHSLGLKDENFYLSFFVCSNAYNRWIKNNPELLADIREQLYSDEVAKELKVAKLTDIKLLDMIFWGQAKRKQKDIS